MTPTTSRLTMRLTTILGTATLALAACSRPAPTPAPEPATIAKTRTDSVMLAPGVQLVVGSAPFARCSASESQSSS